jgi:hypothetical protein
MKYIFLFVLIFSSIQLIGQDDQEHWEAYLANYEKGVGSTLVNMSLKSENGMNQFPFLLKMGVKIKRCSSDRLPEQDEWEHLHKVSDKLKAIIDGNISSKAAGIFSYQCWRTDYYYIADTTVIRQRLMKGFTDFFPDQEYKIEIKQDTGREAYLKFLYPSEEIMEYISNQKVLSELEKAGDNASKPRKVDHWLYFKTEIGRSLFIKYALQQKFKVEAKNYAKDPTMHFSLQLSRTDKINIGTISVITLQLRRKAREFDGDYDGWETFVIKETPSK